MMYDIKSVKPKFGVNYKPGYMGFTFSDDKILSDGIAFFTRWDRFSDIRVSHVLQVTGEDECVEATGSHGVCVSPLHTRFNDPHCKVFFRKPIGLTSHIALRLNNEALKHIGEKYDVLLVAGHALTGTCLGRLIENRFSNNVDRFRDKYFNTDGAWMCSELQAHSMHQQPEYHGLGCLKYPDSAITPQMLFEDSELFEPWKQTIPEN